MTAAPTELLNPLQLDALTELVNIGVSRAAASLREMVGSQVHLSVPNVALVTRAKAISILAEREISNLVAVHQIFEGDITGRALLIFPETKSLELVERLLAETCRLRTSSNWNRKRLQRLAISCSTVVSPRSRTCFNAA
ncbi:MAG: hypothetical protein WDN50_02095 [Bradyrhizobium sp.]